MKDWVPELVTALEAEAADVRREYRGATITLSSGRARDATSVHHAGVSTVWFDTTFEGNPPDDSTGQLRVENKSFPASVLGLEPKRILLSVEHPLGPLPQINEATLQLDPTELLDRLGQTLQREASSDSTTNWQLLGEVSGSESATVGVALAPDCELAGLSPEQKRAVRQCMGSSVTFLQGPPGTGKTHVTAHIVASALKANLTILVTSHTNVAVDQALLALHRQFEHSKPVRHAGIVRVGEPRLDDVPDRYRDTLPSRLPEEREKQLMESEIVFATLSKIYMDHTVWRRTYDIVIIDEVSMINPALAFVGLSRAKKRVVLIGDPHQLPPITQVRDTHSTNPLSQDLFEKTDATSRECFARLTTQRRMRPEIADIARELRYGTSGQLQDDPTTSTRMRPNLRDLPFGDEALHRVHIDMPQGAVLSDPRGSYWNISSALASVEVVRQLATQIEVPSAGERRPIGIIVPFSAQRRLLLQLVDAAGLLNLVLPGTVHTFQGNEADVVVYDPVLAPPVGSHKRLTDAASYEQSSRDINVAVTRARDQFVIVGDQDWLDTIPHLSALGTLHGAMARANAGERLFERADGNRTWDTFASLERLCEKANLHVDRFVLVSGDEKLVRTAAGRIAAWTAANRLVLVAARSSTFENVDLPAGVVPVPWTGILPSLIVSDRFLAGSPDSKSWIVVAQPGPSETVHQLLRLSGLVSLFHGAKGCCPQCGGQMVVAASHSGRERLSAMCQSQHLTAIPRAPWKDSWFNSDRQLELSANSRAATPTKGDPLIDRVCHTCGRRVFTRRASANCRSCDRSVGQGKNA